MTVLVLEGVRCVVLDCGTCGIKFAMPELVYDTHVEEGGFHTCPNGHSRGWDKNRSRREAERREVERLRQKVPELQDEIAAERKRAEKAVANLAHLKKRTVVNGVCPCCTRSFINLKRHMATKHPKYNVVPLKAEHA